ncbi:hypothetical protein AAC387_Pa08g2060 [Persea americana]
MEDNKGSSSSLSAPEAGLDHGYVPDCSVMPPTSRPGPIMDVPVIDIACLRESPDGRARVVEDIGKACRQLGFFQVANHGISESVMEGALSAASDFFALPHKEKMELMSNDVTKPVRYCTSLRDGIDQRQFWRVFLKHYAYPLDTWIKLWPCSPPDYSEKMATYSAQVRILALEVLGAIMESLKLGHTYMSERLEEGMQSRQGLQVMDPDQGGTWKVVPVHPGYLHVHLGDHLEVLTNGGYKSAVHRAILNSEQKRYSIASIHGLAMDDKMETADELVMGDQRTRVYKASSFRDFLDFISETDISKGGSFLDSLKVELDA